MTYRLPGRVLSTNVIDANPERKGLLWVGKVILEPQMHMLDLQLHIKHIITVQSVTQENINYYPGNHTVRITVEGVHFHLYFTVQVHNNNNNLHL